MTGGWEIGSTVATALGTLVALGVAAVSIRQRKEDLSRLFRSQEARALAQARLVRAGWGNPGHRPLDGGMYQIELPFANHSDRPVLDVYGEVWLGDREDPSNPRAVHADILLPHPRGEEQWLTPAMAESTADLSLAAWRIRWTDADGNQWYVDHAGADPKPFAGQPPNSY
jgi:hypothetical protein